MASYSYNPYPTPTEGSGTVFGKVPGATPLPQPAADLATAAPGIAGLPGTIAKTLSDKLGGQISSGTQAALQDAAARYGLNVGQPGMSPLAYHNLFGNIAGFAENQANQAIQQYGPFAGAVSQTSTVNPALQAKIAADNALQAAAPSPAAAQSHAENLFASYLASVRGPGTSTRGPAAGGGITRDALSSGFGSPDQVYQSTAPGEWFGGGMENLTAAPSTAVPTGNLSAGGPGTGTGQFFKGDAANYSPADNIDAWLEQIAGP